MDLLFGTDISSMTDPFLVIITIFIVRLICDDLAARLSKPPDVNTQSISKKMLKIWLTSVVLLLM